MPSYVNELTFRHDQKALVEGKTTVSENERRLKIGEERGNAMLTDSAFLSACFKTLPPYANYELLKASLTLFLNEIVSTIDIRKNKSTSSRARGATRATKFPCHDPTPPPHTRKPLSQVTECSLLSLLIGRREGFATIKSGQRRPSRSPRYLLFQSNEKSI